MFFKEDVDCRYVCVVDCLGLEKCFVMDVMFVLFVMIVGVFI